MMGGEFGEPANGEFVRAAGRQGEQKIEFGFFRLQAIDFLQNRQGKGDYNLDKSGARCSMTAIGE